MTQKTGLSGKFLIYITNNFLLSSLLLTTLIFFKPVNISAQNTLTKVGQWGGGPCYDVAVKGNYAYVGNGLMLQVLDISNPADPKVVGEVLTNTLIRKVVVSGNYAYTISPFQIIDISNPTNPILVTTFQHKNSFSKIKEYQDEKTNFKIFYFPLALYFFIQCNYLFPMDTANKWSATLEPW